MPHVVGPTILPLQPKGDILTIDSLAIHADQLGTKLKLFTCYNFRQHICIIFISVNLFQHKKYDHQTLYEKEILLGVLQKNSK